MSKFGVNAAVLCLSVSAFFCGCGSGGGGGGPGASSPSGGVYAGAVFDPDGNPVVGARVSVDGIEAEGVTGPEGSFKVSDSKLATDELDPPAGMGLAAASRDLEISVLAPGFAPYVSSLQVNEGESINLNLVRSGLEPNLTITNPTPNKLFVVPDSCASPQVTVEGLAKLGAVESFRLDIALVIDRSGSTRRAAFDVNGDGTPDTVLEAELSAARCFVGGLDPTTTRVCVLSFNDSAAVVGEFDSNLDAVASTLADVGPSSGGTNFEAAFSAAQDAFLSLAASDKVQEEADESPAVSNPAPFRAVVFLSDGIATSHGVPRDMTDTNLTQSRADRLASIDAARSLGQATGAQLFAYSIIPANDPDRKRTTLPHCVAVCGGGRYESLTDFALLSSSLCGQPLVSLLSVELRNLTTGSPPVGADLAPDGFFSQPVLVATGPESLVGAAGPDGTVINTLQVTLTFDAGAETRTATRSFDVRLITEAAYTSLDLNEIFTAQAAAQPVSAESGLKTPLGNDLPDNDIYNFLVGGSQGELEDATELYGAKTFTATDPTGGGASAVTLNVDFVYKEACYRSDVGYVIIDPAHPPQSYLEALSGITSANILFNSGAVGAATCNAVSIPAGSGSFQVTVATGSVLVFFILPNRTLSDYLAHPRSGHVPLFTLSSLNPGGFDQVMTFRSLVGRTEPGASQTVVAPGPLMLFAFEDIPIASRTSDQDFSDVLFTVSNGIFSRPQDASCHD